MPQPRREPVHPLCRPARGRRSRRRGRSRSRSRTRRAPIPVDPNGSFVAGGQLRRRVGQGAGTWQEVVVSASRSLAKFRHSRPMRDGNASLRKIITALRNCMKFSNEFTVTNPAPETFARTATKMLSGIDLFQVAGDRMRYLTERQTVIARNIANADTPGYKAQDLTPFSAGCRQAGRRPRPAARRRWCWRRPTRHICQLDSGRLASQQACRHPGRLWRRKAKRQHRLRRGTDDQVGRRLQRLRHGQRGLCEKHQSS